MVERFGASGSKDKGGVSREALSKQSQEKSDIRGPVSRAALAALAAFSITSADAVSHGAEAQTSPINIEASKSSWKDGLKELQGFAQREKGIGTVRAFVLPNGHAAFFPPGYRQSEILADAEKRAVAVCDIRVHTQAWGNKAFEPKADGLPMELPPLLLETDAPLVEKLSPFNYMSENNEAIFNEERPSGQLHIKGVMSPNGVMHYPKNISYSDESAAQAGALMSFMGGNWWEPNARKSIQKILDKMEVADPPFQIFVARGWHEHVAKKMEALSDAQVGELVNKLSPTWKKSLDIRSEGESPEKVAWIRRITVLESIQTDQRDVVGAFFAGDEVGMQKQEAFVQFIRKPMKDAIVSFFDEYKEYARSSAEAPPSQDAQARLARAYEKVGVELGRDAEPERLPCGIDPKKLEQQQQ